MADGRRIARLAAAYCAAADEWYHIAGRDTGATTTAEHIAIRMSESVLAADPLRALLADEDRAVEVGAKARYLASTVSAEPDWERQTRRAKDSYRDQVREPVRAVLAALREVANGATR